MHDLSDWNVLVVDDEPDNIGVLELVFRYHKANVFVAENGTKCLEVMNQKHISLILMDIQMPDLSGYDLFKIIRKNVHWQHIPIIAVTAFAMSGDSEQIIASGFDGYIAKPISAMTIVNEVMAILDSGVA
jgi:CheY-like chemotaxis protein